MTQKTKYSGSCVCGNVTYSANNLISVCYCHCEQCRRMTGNFMAASQVQLDQIKITGEPKWFYVGKKSRHGFCGVCGSQMFWFNECNDYMSVTLGCVNDTKHLKPKQHIFTSEKAKYYDISDGYPQFLKWSKEPSNLK